MLISSRFPNVISSQIRPGRRKCAFLSIEKLTQKATEERSESARLSSFVGAIAVGDLVKSTLGPKGMNKILHSLSTGSVEVTNDGATILKSIQLDNAAAKVSLQVFSFASACIMHSFVDVMNTRSRLFDFYFSAHVLITVYFPPQVLVNISKVQDDEVGDGTTSVCVLASELLREAERLIEDKKIHPQIVVEGFRRASRVALKSLEDSAGDNRCVFFHLVLDLG